MKRYMIILILLLSLGFTACGSENIDEIAAGESSVAEQTINNETTVAEHTTVATTKPTLDNVPPSDQMTFHFDSYAELKDIFAKENQSETSAIGADDEIYGIVYQATIKALANEELPLVMPLLNGQPITLRNEEGLPRVSLMTKELYNLPWIWYHCVQDDANIIICTSFVDVLNHPDIDASKTYVDILSVICPEAPMPDNAENFPHYEAIYERELTLANNRVVTALIADMKDSPRIYVKFHLDGVLVSIRGDDDVLTDEFFADFSLEEFETPTVTESATESQT